MFLLDFINAVFDSILSWLGVIKKEATIVFVGLDNAGKSTLMQQLKNSSHETVCPTERAQMEEVVLNNITFKAWDLGGHETWRHIWSDFFEQADAILFMVDAADRERIEEANEELEMLLEDPELQHTPLLVLGNKIDLEDALDRDSLIKELGLADLKLGGPQDGVKTDRPVEVFRVSVIEEKGYSEAFEWLAGVLNDEA
eukprot:TRINITY_DN2015_c0_g1_i2.p1 TRINITY_DN2015_c0_g1~~TRINITY_DN2015_c0_g1_i2.p1  ORF type:complete len:214 (-),score=61.76 TRINITY_DN2015_c0_g1_i2:208-804(-)